MIANIDAVLSEYDADLMIAALHPSLAPRARPRSPRTLDS